MVVVVALLLVGGGGDAAAAGAGGAGGGVNDFVRVVVFFNSVVGFMQHLSISVPVSFPSSRCCSCVSRVLLRRCCAAGAVAGADIEYWYCAAGAMLLAMLLVLCCWCYAAGVRCVCVVDVLEAVVAAGQICFSLFLLLLVRFLLVPLVLVLCWCCAGAVLVLCWCCAGAVLVLCWCCAGGTAGVNDRVCVMVVLKSLLGSRISQYFLVSVFSFWVVLFLRVLFALPLCWCWCLCLCWCWYCWC